jgi:nitroreductase
MKQGVPSNSNQADTFLELVRQRYSCRAYSSVPVAREKLELIIEAARLAPSACNFQGWRFVVADDPQVRDELARKGMGGVVPNVWAAAAPVIIAGCFAKKILSTNWLGSKLKGIDYGQLDMGIAGEHIALMAAALGLGTCWIGWFNQKAVKKILGVPRAVEVVFLMTLGYPAEASQREKARKSRDEIFTYNRYR